MLVFGVLPTCFMFVGLAHLSKNMSTTISVPPTKLFSTLLDAITQAATTEVSKNAQIFVDLCKDDAANKTTFYKLLLRLCRDAEIINEKQFEKLKEVQQADEANVEPLFVKLYQKLRASNLQQQQKELDEKKLKKQQLKASIASEAVKDDTVKECVAFLSSSVKSNITKDHLRLHLILCQMSASAVEKAVQLSQFGFVTDWLVKLVNKDGSKENNIMFQAIGIEGLSLWCTHYRRMAYVAFQKFRYDCARKRYEKENEKRRNKEKNEKNLLKRKKEKEIQQKQQELTSAGADADALDLQHEEEELLKQKAELEGDDDEDLEEDIDFDENADEKVVAVKTVLMKKAVIAALCKTAVESTKLQSNANEYTSAMATVTQTCGINACLDLVMSHREGSVRFEEISVLLLKAGASDLILSCLANASTDVSLVFARALNLLTYFTITGTAIKGMYPCIERCVQVLKQLTPTKESTTPIEDGILTLCASAIANAVTKYAKFGTDLLKSHNADFDLLKKLVILIKYRKVKKGEDEESVHLMNFAAYSALTALVEEIQVDQLLEFDAEEGLTDMLTRDTKAAVTDYFSKSAPQSTWQNKTAAAVLLRVVSQKYKSSNDARASDFYARVLDSKSLTILYETMERGNIAINTRFQKKTAKKRGKGDEPEEQPQLTAEERIFTRFFVPAAVSCYTSNLNNVAKCNNEANKQKLVSLFNSDPKYQLMFNDVQAIEKRKVETSISPKMVIIGVIVLVVLLLSFPVIYRLFKPATTPNFPPGGKK